MKSIYYLMFGLVINASIYQPVQAQPSIYSPLENQIDPLTHPSMENQTRETENAFPAINHANDLITQPATINHNWMQFSNRQQLNFQSNNTIPLIRQEGCRNVNPLDFLKDPGTVLKECEKQANIEPPQRTEQLEYFKVPRLDSGVKLQVTDF